MNTLQIIFAVSMLAWFLSEFLYKNILKSGETDRKDKDRSTLNFLWMAIPFSIISAVTLSYYTRFPIAHDIWILYLGEALILIGIIVRFIIIRSLGKYFTVDVTIRKDHTIKKEGFYRYLRHPSYTFSLLTSLGLGLYLNNWLSLAFAFIPPFIAFSYRIKIEEDTLIEQFGEEYLEYRRKTKKLIPFVY
ncbi:MULTISPECIES: methyltransferase family protein [Chryseobacterium]|uniref:Protein-S-isoprenylcysteine O-methyltransferase Ste14 n=1 Tax=Chryseobacterium camelliae TaxID=1265445 RepID=A0ABU0TPI0_9FLAO|nr:MULTISPECIES: isoprenylcysteine carboxylmethyltransferase family protein [Chryseobacterium]MDT3407963.1 protein-S-isoprenylcysteine O-methyltransferase Ste14 [Pseudacidovorax intermedius]MDQ1098178.1 protein-S-isoprenylcysteine O-methyltransferase Ste14 [Chryseobacterium camelliae]MDQ1102108.1 protein-S-isoprenylcysteine O-methyltransferase Ste14 [Chryseobacterium sp. SORGH_AS_1048]MDR6085546.1 protein-S-isoprenylcysteine O-methyltransferase Ste14 [Chryseobacterium sp. SORGH_AS_0909]MDR6129